MYIERLLLKNVRTFLDNSLDFVYPDMGFRPAKPRTTEEKRLLPRPRLPNVNLLLGDNAAGKSTVLQAISLASLGPAAPEAQIPFRKLVRLAPSNGQTRPLNAPDNARIEARLRLQQQDQLEDTLPSALSVSRRGELERLEFKGPRHGAWDPVFESTNDAFFCVGYGSTRRVDHGDSSERGARPKVSFMRGQRVLSLFQDSFPLFSLVNWLGEVKVQNPDRYDEVSELLNALVGRDHYRFTGDLQEREYLFERGQTRVPFQSLSDGYRAFIGWVGDLLYHLNYARPSGTKLADSVGIVMVDEIDLHLHPKWQMSVIQTIAKALPRLQFIFTSHSPLIAGSLEWMNIITLRTSPTKNATTSRRLKESIHGLDADQVLISEFFGLSTTRAPTKARRLDKLTELARSGDREAAKQVIDELANGTEDAE